MNKSIAQNTTLDALAMTGISLCFFFLQEGKLPEAIVAGLVGIACIPVKYFTRTQ